VDKEKIVFRMIDHMINSQSSGQTSCAPLTDAHSILQKLAGNSNMMIDVMSHDRLTHSSSKSREMKNYCVSQHEIRYKSFISHILQTPNSIANVISDNYNPSKENRYGITKWDRVDTLNSLLSINFLPDGSDPLKFTPTLQQFHKDDFIEYWHLISSSNWIDPSFLRMNLPVRSTLPKLYDHVAHPLIGGKSSSKEDVNSLILKNVMKEELHCHERYSSLTVDPEPFNLIISLIHENPNMITDELRYLIPMVGMFHLRKHYLEGSLLDHMSYLLLWQHMFPFSKEVKQKDSEKRKKRMIEDMFEVCKPHMVRKMDVRDKKKWKMLKDHFLGDGSEDPSFEATFFPTEGNKLIVLII